MKSLFGSSKKLRKQLESQTEIISTQAKLIEEASLFIKEIEKGNLKINGSEALVKNELGISILSMHKHLSKIVDDEQERTWMNEGLAKFSDILRNKESHDLQELANNILKNLVKYVGAIQGAIFILTKVEEEEEEEEYLEMIACYAFDRKKYLHKKIAPGEGLVGQCILEKENIYLTEIPSDYINITSGLGGANPGSVFISPLMINENIFGVIELASFGEIAPYKRDFINKLSENIASSIKNVKDSEQTLLLLNSSQQQAEELRAQEEEMRQNMEEMMATQEEMIRKNDEIARVAAEAEGILKGINATMATIEFTTEGLIKTANENFLSTVKYSLEDIQDKHHRMFVPQEILETEDYKIFWKKLASGIAASGIFKRINSKGEVVWLNAIYNPILNAHGKVIKVVKFASNITAEQEMMAESKGLINGINSTMATIEFTPEGNVITANENFLTTMRYSLEEIKAKHHRLFVPQEILDTKDYQTFWSRLAYGVPLSGIFKRMNSKGETVWLNAIYNPILNASGEVIKIVKFASDITTEQEIMAENKGILSGINKTMATIEFTKDGTVLTANQNFLKVMKYTIEDIKGKHHRKFVSREVLQTEDYQTFWTRLAKGVALSGVFERIDSTGETVWLNAIYNPILNASGEVIKVIKFATDITAEKKDNEEETVTVNKN